MSPTEEPVRAHWNSVARSWHLYSSPLRPCAEDLAAYFRFAQAHGQVPAEGATAALILGITPEIATMPWPAATVVTGVDASQEMLDHVWPGDIPGVRQAQCIDWFALPSPELPYDVVIGDGSLSMMRYPDDLRRLVAKLRTLVRPGGLLITRSFARPGMRESVAALSEAAQAGAAGSFHAFKFRLAMAMQSSPEEGVALDDVWQFWQRLTSMSQGLPHLNGWSPDVVGTMNFSRSDRMRLSFLTVDELIATLEAEGMSLLERYIPGYEMGDRCPILAWRF